MFAKALSLAGGIAGAVGLSQFPEFSQQYAQRLGGAVDELARVVEDFDADASDVGLNRDEALSQLSRAVEQRDDKRPQLSDLRESGSIEQDADAVMFVFREEYYVEREKPSDDRLDEMAAWQDRMANLHGKAEVIIGKQRHGPIGTVELSFEGQFTRFGNLVKPWQQDGGGQNF